MDFNVGKAGNSIRGVCRGTDPRMSATSGPLRQHRVVLLLPKLQHNIFVSDWSNSPPRSCYEASVGGGGVCVCACGGGEIPVEPVSTLMGSWELKYVTGNLLPLVQI